MRTLTAVLMLTALPGVAFSQGSLLDRYKPQSNPDPVPKPLPSEERGPELSTNSQKAPWVSADETRAHAQAHKRIQADPQAYLEWRRQHLQSIADEPPQRAAEQGSPLSASPDFEPDPSPSSGATRPLQPPKRPQRRVFFDNDPARSEEANDKMRSYRQSVHVISPRGVGFIEGMPRRAAPVIVQRTRIPHAEFDPTRVYVTPAGKTLTPYLARSGSLKDVLASLTRQIQWEPPNWNAASACQLLLFPKDVVFLTDSVANLLHQAVEGYPVRVGLDSEKRLLSVYMGEGHSLDACSGRR